MRPNPLFRYGTRPGSNGRELARSCWGKCAPQAVEQVDRLVSFGRTNQTIVVRLELISTYAYRSSYGWDGLHLDSVTE